MKQQKVASRRERLFFEDLIQEDKQKKSSESSQNSNLGKVLNKIGSSNNNSIPKINSQMNFSPYAENLDSFKPNENIRNEHQNRNIQNNNTKTKVYNNNPDNNSKIPLISKRDKKWEEKRRIKINSQNSYKSNSQIISNNNQDFKHLSNYNHLRNNNQITTPFIRDKISENQNNFNARVIPDNALRNITPNINQQVFTPQSNINNQNMTMNTNVNNNQRMIPTPILNQHGMINSNNSTNNLNLGNNQLGNSIMTHSNNNSNTNLNYKRSNTTNMAISPNTVHSNNFNQNHVGYSVNPVINRGTPYNNTQSYNSQINTPYINNTNNQYNSANISAHPGQSSTHRTPLIHNINNSNQQPQYNRMTPSQYINPITPLNNQSNYPVRNIISQTPMNYNTNNNNNNYSKPPSSQNNKPFSNENISFRNLHNVTPGMIPENSRNNSAYIGRDNNKFIFEKNNVIY
jgi:hypothetical protein